VTDVSSIFSWLALAGGVCVAAILLDGWFLQPRREQAGRRDATPWLSQAAGILLLVLCVAMLWQLFRYEAAEFSLVLVVLGAVSGFVWLFDWLLFARRRAAVGVKQEPLGVEYARSFFPVIALVLVIRSFVFEPFRIPSDSMMPTLFDGDFIFVSKYSYGLRLPVSNTLLVPTGAPQRGDVVVFRLPPNPKINYIKRLIGLPGDRIRVDDNNLLYVNDKPIPQMPDGEYHGPKQDTWEYNGAMTAYEQLGQTRHQLMFANKPSRAGEWVVPAEHYFFMGDNRNNSEDSRFLDNPMAPGFVPERNLVGKAVRVWLNLDTRDGPQWRRIGHSIQ
jgi:signal peptidase I